jgi:hypothetical protein
VRVVETPYRILCNRVQREATKLTPILTSELVCYVPLHKTRYGIKIDTTSLAGSYNHAKRFVRENDAFASLLVFQ